MPKTNGIDVAGPVAGVVPAAGAVEVPEVELGEEAKLVAAEEEEPWLSSMARTWCLIPSRIVNGLSVTHYTTEQQVYIEEKPGEVGTQAWATVKILETRAGRARLLQHKYYRLTPPS